MGEEETTLFDQIGGEEAVASLVGDFYRRVLADVELRPFFEGVSIEKLAHIQREFFAAALDGPIVYQGRSIREIHVGMGIELRHLQRFLGHLLATLKDRDLDDRAVYDIYSRINCYADDITGTTSVDG